MLCSVGAAVGATQEPSRAFESSLFKAQCSQDRWSYDNIFSHLGDRSVKTFVEFGARDGVRNSNSYFYEKALQWQGVLIEAGIDDLPRLRANRRCTLNKTHHNHTACVHGALGSEDEGSVEHQTYCGSVVHRVPCTTSTRQIIQGSESFRAAASDALHGTDAIANYSTGRVRVPRISLNRTLHRLGMQQIGLLSADCEGCEVIPQPQPQPCTRHPIPYPSPQPPPPHHPPLNPHSLERSSTLTLGNTVRSSCSSRRRPWALKR